MTFLESLKIRIMTEGVSVSGAAHAQLAGEDGDRPLTLADFASTSGIALRLGDQIWVNAPIAAHNPNFIEAPGVELGFDQGGGFYIAADGDLVPALPLPVPEYHDQTNWLGEPYTHYAYTHTDRVRISPIEGCALSCSFCDMSFTYDYRTKRAEGLVEAVQVALDDPVLPARHVLISGGTPLKDDYSYLSEVYEQVLGAFPLVSVDIMMTPLAEVLDLDRLDRIGVNQLAVNMELFNPEAARRLMPGKGRIGPQGYLDFIERAVDRLGPGRVRSLILVGLEETADTVAGVAALADRGCEPVLSPFRPDPATPLSGLKPPGGEVLSEVYQRSREVSEARGVKLGPRCIPCMHNTLTFPDDSGYYFNY